jgi:outer membrane protein OmpA-like peptidoglycan-associated protein
MTLPARVAAIVALSAAAALPAAAQPGATKPAPVMPASDVSEAALIDALDPVPDPSKGTTRSFKRDRQVSLLIEFRTNSTQLTGEAKGQLAIVGRALRSPQLAPYRFVVEGHADPRGRADANQKLSEGRAASVRQYLVRAESVAAIRLKAIGKGDREPLNRDDPAAPENRRVTFITVRN